MHKFKNNVSDGWLFKQELRLFKNFASNWKREVDDSDFFDVFSNSNNSDSEEAVEFFTANFTTALRDPQSRARRLPHRQAVDVLSRR